MPLGNRRGPVHVRVVETYMGALAGSRVAGWEGLLLTEEATKRLYKKDEKNYKQNLRVVLFDTEKASQYKTFNHNSLEVRARGLHHL